MNTVGKVAIIIGLAFGIQVCTSVTEERKDTAQNAQKGNFKSFDLEYKGHEFDAANAKTITHPTGSHIQIPANAFIDAAGKAVKGKVKVNYREFHTASDIITSGITMMYDSAGKKRPFETAGMFEIRAEQNGKPVFLAKDKGIKVDLASFKDGAFNFYYLQEAKKEERMAYLPAMLIQEAVAQTELRPGEDQWQLLQSSKMPVENQERKEKLAAINKKLPTEPKEPLPYDSKKPVLDFHPDTKDFPELNTFEGIVWQYAGEETDNTQNPEKNEWIYEHSWTNMTLEAAEDMTYRLVLTSANKSFTSLVRPSLQGADYQKAKALFAQKRADYEAGLKDRAAELEKLRQEKNYYDRLGKFTRSFVIQNLGVYNCDRIYREDDAIEIAAKIDIDDPSAMKSSRATAYLITENVGALPLDLYSSMTTHLNINPKRKHSIVCVFGGSDKVGVLSWKDMQKLNLDKVSKGEKVAITLTSIPEKIHSTAALEELLAKLQE